MNTFQIQDIAESLAAKYQRELRRQARVRMMAQLFRIAAAALLLMGFGVALASIGRFIFVCFSVPVLIAGVWGQHYITTRH